MKDSKRIAIYPGSFDPVTNGHLDVIKRALRIFDKVIIAVGDNPEKKALFSVEERLEMLNSVTTSMENIEIDRFTGLMIDYAKKRNATVIIRGLRAVSDFDFEFQRALINRNINENIETIFIMTAGEYCFLNSGIVKEMAKFGGSIEGLVPIEVERELNKKLNILIKRIRHVPK